MPLSTRRSSIRGFPWLFGKNGRSRSICSSVSHNRSLIPVSSRSLNQIATLISVGPDPKQLMRQTDASERTVKHWLSGQHGPDSVYFLRLAVSSAVIRAFVLGLIDGPAAIPLTGPVDRISLVRAREAYAAGDSAGGRSATGARKNVPERVPKRDPINAARLFSHIPPGWRQP